MYLVHLFAFISLCYGFVSNITPLSPVTIGNAKTPATLTFSGDYVCDKYSSTIQSQNGTANFPVDFNLYVAASQSAPSDNYTVDFYFKNEYHQTLNEFSVLNASDSHLVLAHYNPQLISSQPNFGVEFQFNFAKGLLCQFLYQFTVAYQLQRLDNPAIVSDKIFLVGSCQLNQQFHPAAYADLTGQGYRCVEYNSGYKYDGGMDWCSQFYPVDQCCKSYDNDELATRNACLG